LPEDDRHHAQKRKNIALLLALVALIVLLYAITLMKLGVKV
jgi:hypothetical protein